MQIVIDIPEAVLNRICFTVTYPLDMVIVCNAIHEHIKLPKGHGRLIDADAFIDGLRDSSKRQRYNDGTKPITIREFNRIKKEENDELIRRYGQQ